MRNPTVLVTLLLACSTAATAQQGADAYSTMSPEGLRTGVIVGEAECNRDREAAYKLDGGFY